MTPQERRERLRLLAKEASMERQVLRALQALQNDPTTDWLTSAVQRGNVSVESLPNRLSGAADLVRRTFADSYAAAQKGIQAWRR
jgi:hypothetical protein